MEVTIDFIIHRQDWLKVEIPFTPIVQIDLLKDLENQQVITDFASVQIMVSNIGFKRIDVKPTGIKCIVIET